MWRADRQEYCSTLSGRRCWTHVRRTWAESVARPCRCSWPIGVPSETHDLRLKHVLKVILCGADSSWVHEQTQFVLHSSCYRQPMQLNQCRCDVVPWPEVADESRCCIHDPLQWRHRRLWKCCQQRVAVVEPRQYERGDQTGGNVATKQTTYLPQSSQLEEAGLCRVGVMRPHVEFRV